MRAIVESKDKLSGDYLTTLVLLQDMSTLLPDNKINEVMMQGLKDFPGVESICWQNHPAPQVTKNSIELPLQYGTANFGYLQLTCSDKTRLLPFLPYLYNFAGLMAVVIDTKHKEKKATTIQERFFELAPDLLCIANNKGYLTKLSASWEKKLGWSREELCAQPYINFIHPDDVALTLSTQASLNSGQPINGYVNRYRHKDGSYLWLEWTSYLETENLIFASARDISATRAIAKELQLAASVYNNTNEAIFVFNQNGEILSVNQAFTNITGFPFAQIVGQQLHTLDNDTIHTTNKFSDVLLSLADNPDWKGETWCRQQSGPSVLTYCNITLVQDDNASTNQRFVCVMNDITEQKQNLQRIHQLAYHDSLTGLANRTLLEDRLDHSISVAQRNQQRMAVLFIDLDNFKGINDTLGHDMGDYVLKVQSERLLSCVRKSDTVARMGGDEFVIFVDTIKDSTDLSNLAQKIITTLCLPIEAENHSIQVTSSIGIAIYPDDGNERVSLMKCADTAMYTAKAFGKNAFRYFSAAMMETVDQRLKLETELRSAIENNQFEMYYQPRINLASKEISGAEALIRWNHPDKGLICPMHFIPYAEESGLINDIGLQVISKVIQQIAQWKSLLAHEIPIAINISALQFNKGQIKNTIVQECRNHNVSPKLLELEVTESVVMNNPEKASVTLQELRKLGIRIAIDDFGTGHSSLAYLKKLPLDTLKIDQSFVRDIHSNADDNAIVKIIVALAKVLKLELIAEGVELSIHEKMLDNLHCEHAQGYYYARPMPAREFAHFMLIHQSPSASVAE